MWIAGHYILLTVALFATTAATVFFVEVLAAVLWARKPNSWENRSARRPQVAVLVPAHNESTGLEPTLTSIKSQLRPSDRLLVVADNCTDDTFSVAAALGAETIAREDILQRGKGYALDYGIGYLSNDPPEVVIVIDADCWLGDGAIDLLASQCRAFARPIQALDLMKAPDGLLERYDFAEFAWRVKNWVRPLGLKALNLPCQLAGTGMAFPWEIIQTASVASSAIVEDLKLGLEFTRAGKPPLFCPQASVVSFFPISVEAAETQRQRWEQGHLSMIMRAVPRTALAALCEGNFALLVLCLDLAVPPIFSLALVEISLLVIAMAAACLGLPRSTLYLMIAGVVVLSIALVLCWLVFGRDILPIRRVLTVPGRVLEKLRLYRRIFLRSQTHWIRTDRN
ncbi:glycosyltransferase family 2 protein [Bradyrhizobium genosp. P]|uniref:glycosyltransferase family 2 protein n=1 Tax=Bradyrhizobium genosp. P TaxID=83641 RepID=UPI003CE77F30